MFELNKTELVLIHHMSLIFYKLAFMLASGLDIQQLNLFHIYYSITLDDKKAYKSHVIFSLLVNRNGPEMMRIYVHCANILSWIKDFE